MTDAQADTKTDTPWDLPRVGVLLDEQTMQPILQRAVRAVGVEICRVAVRRFLPHRRGRLVVEYDVSIAPADGRSKRAGVLYLRAPQVQAASHPAEEPTDSQPAPAAFGVDPSGVFHQDDELGVTIHSRDRDPDLTQMTACLDARRIADALDDPRPLTPRVVAYRAGRRFVVAYDHGAHAARKRVLIAKAFADDRAAKLADAYGRLADPIEKQSHHRVRVPRLIRHIPSWRAMLIEAVPTDDEPGDDSSHRPAEQGSRLARAAAEVMACIHQSSIPGLKDFDTDRQRRTLRDWHRWLELAKVDGAAPAMDWFETLESFGAGCEPEQSTVIHGDFYEAQLAAGADRVTLFDLDTLAVGDPAFDVGNFLAHQWLWCLRHGLAFDDHQRLGLRTLADYESRCGRLSDAGLRYHWAGALFRIGAIHAFRAKTGHCAGRLLDTARLVLQQGRDVFVGKNTSGSPKQGRHDQGTARCA